METNQTYEMYRRLMLKAMQQDRVEVPLGDAKQARTLRARIYSFKAWTALKNPGDKELLEAFGEISLRVEGSTLIAERVISSPVFSALAAVVGEVEGDVQPIAPLTKEERALRSELAELGGQDGLAKRMEQVQAQTTPEEQARAQADLLAMMGLPPVVMPEVAHKPPPAPEPEPTSKQNDYVTLPSGARMPASYARALRHTKVPGAGDA